MIDQFLLTSLECRVLSELIARSHISAMSCPQLAKYSGSALSSVYVIIRRLAFQGYVRRREVKTESGKPLVVYSITRTGIKARARFAAACGLKETP
jgi:predicted transcriptional regulator